MRSLAILGLLLVSIGSHAETPQQIRQIYASEAANQQAGFTASAKRGEALFRQRFALNDKMPACTSCHTDNPLNGGQHAVTGKTIKPIAVAANGERQFESVLLAEKAAALAGLPGRRNEAAEVFNVAAGLARDQLAVAWSERIASRRAKTLG